MNTETTKADPILLSPLDVWHQANGARMVDFAGMSLPLQYGGIKLEHLATREKAGLFDISHMVQMRLDGEANALISALAAIFPIDFQQFKAGQSRYSYLLAEDGGILDDVIISHAGDHFVLVANGARRNHDPAYLQSLLPNGIGLSILIDQAFLALQGPKADAVLKNLISHRPEVYFMHTQSINWKSKDGQEHNIRLFRQGYTGEDGWEISLPAAIATEFAESLRQNPEVTLCGLGARDSLRLEAGLPLWGHDIDASTSPVTAGLQFAIAQSRRDTPDFIGATTLLDQLTRPPKQQRVGLIVEGKQPVREGSLLFDRNTEIGRVTSGGFSPSLGQPIAMALLDRTHARVDTSVEAEVRGKRLDTRVCKLPFVALHYHHAPKG